MLKDKNEVLSFYSDLISRFPFEKEGKLFLQNKGNELILNHFDDIDSLFLNYEKSGFNTDAVKDKKSAFAEKINEKIEIINFVFYAVSFMHLKEKFKAENIDENIFFDTAADLYSKSVETFKMKGFYGITCDSWYDRFIRFEMFTLGRFQYQKRKLERDIDFKEYGLNYKKGETALFLHIPSGGAMDEKSRIDSYKRAYDFFPEFHKNGIIGFFCHSWLLYLDNLKIFSEKSNSVSFLKEFHITEQYEDDFTDTCPRIFYKEYDFLPQNLSEETSMQRAVKKWLMSGRSMGNGCGMILFDGKNIL